MNESIKQSIYLILSIVSMLMTITTTLGIPPKLDLDLAGPRHTRDRQTDRPSCLLDLPAVPCLLDLKPIQNIQKVSIINTNESQKMLVCISKLKSNFKKKWKLAHIRYLFIMIFGILDFQSLFNDIINYCTRTYTFICNSYYHF